jgi:hypothetical protein
MGSRNWVRGAGLLVMLPLLVLAAQAGVVLRWDFEGSDPFHGLAIEGEAPEVVADPVRPGNKVMRARLDPGSERAERSEVRWDGLLPGQERWIGVKVLVPEASEQPFICLFQIGPIRYRDLADAANGGYIQYQQRASGRRKGDWVLRGFFERFGGDSIDSEVGKIDFGKWESWIARVRPVAGETGLIEVWKGRKKVLEIKGKTVKESDFDLLPIKWGIYVGAGNRLQGSAFAYYDNIVIADENFDLVQMSKALE